MLYDPLEATFRVIFGCLVGLEKVVHQPEVVAIHRDEGFEVLLGKSLIEDGATLPQVPAIAGLKHNVNKVAQVAGSVGLDGKLTPNSALRAQGKKGTSANLFEERRSASVKPPVASFALDLGYLAIPIFQRALLAGCVLAALLALLGVLVTARGLAYLGDGLSHAAFGGIALGMFLGLAAPLLIAIPFTALAAMAIGALRRRGGLRSDVAMAILFAVCFAVGVVLLKKAKRTESTFDPEQLLFGNILMVGADDLWIVLGIAAITLAFVAFAWTRLAYATFDEELARLSGIEVGWLESALLALLAAVVVAAIRLAGVVLVSAFLVIPAAGGRVARTHARGRRRMGDALGRPRRRSRLRRRAPPRVARGRGDRPDARHALHDGDLAPSRAPLNRARNPFCSRSSTSRQFGLQPFGNGFGRFCRIDLPSIGPDGGGCTHVPCPPERKTSPVTGCTKSFDDIARRGAFLVIELHVTFV